MCIDCTYYSEGKQYSPKYFGTNCCWKISFSHGFNAHVPQVTNNIPWTVSPPRANVIFTCIEWAYYSECKTIFSEIFHHQQLLENFIFTPTQCTCSQAANSTFWSISMLRAAEIFNFHVYQVHLLLQTLNNILLFRHWQLPKDFIFTWTQRTCSQAAHRIPCSIPALTGAELFHLHVC